MEMFVNQNNDPVRREKVERVVLHWRNEKISVISVKFIIQYCTVNWSITLTTIYRFQCWITATSIVVFLMKFDDWQNKKTTPKKKRKCTKKMTNPIDVLCLAVNRHFFDIQMLKIEPTFPYDKFVLFLWVVYHLYGNQFINIATR